MSPSVYQLPSLNNQLYPLPATHSSQQTTESGVHSQSTSFTLPSNDIQVPSTNIQQTHAPPGLFHQPVLASGTALYPTPAQGTLHDIFSGTCFTNTNPYNYTRQSISKPLALGISPKIKAQIWSHEYIDLGCLINTKFANTVIQWWSHQKGALL